MTGNPTMNGPRAAKSESTRSKLIDAALELWGDRGVNAVSIVEILELADQRNASALHYHFGSRDNLLAAVVNEFVPRIRERRSELLAHAQASGDLRSAAEALILPLGDLLLGDYRSRAYLRVGANLMTNPAFDATMQDVLDVAATAVAFGLIAQRAGYPAALQPLRSRVGGMMVLHALADYSKLVPKKHISRSLSRCSGFISNLVDMYVGAVDAPVSDATSKIVQRSV